MMSDYAAQRINSERSLQASVWSHLNVLLSARTRRMFIEPCMSVRGAVTETRYPDIVVCNSREVIGIVELKYQPRTRPSWTKDLATFLWVSERKSAISITNSRFRGVDSDSRHYPLAESLLYVWAGVHADPAIHLTDHIETSLSPYFMELHAVTSRETLPLLR